jgi:hypothetical protein
MPSVPLTTAVEPAFGKFTVIRGFTYAAEIELWEDEDHTAPFNLTGWTTELYIAGFEPLTVAGGLSIPTPAAGVVELLLDTAQTAAYPVNKYHCYVSVAKSGVRLPPLAGVFQVVDP